MRVQKNIADMEKVVCPLQSTHTSRREHPHIFCADLQSLPAISATPRKPTILPPHVRPHFTRKWLQRRRPRHPWRAQSTRHCLAMMAPSFPPSRASCARPEGDWASSRLWFTAARKAQAYIPEAMAMLATDRR